MVSVCMACYNGEKYIREQVESILIQLNEGDELIVSDDGSTDSTLDVIKEFSDSRIRIITNPGQRGYTSNFYNALKEAKGDVIFLSDQDDIWCCNKVDITLQELKEVDFVHADAMIIDETGHVLCKSRNRQLKVRNGFWANLTRSRYIGCGMAFNRNVLESIFPVPTYSNKYPHDLWIALIAERYFKTKLLDCPLMMYRRHGENASDGGEGGKLSIMSIIKKVMIRFYYLYYVVKQKC